MNYKQVEKFYGSQAGIAKAIGVSRQRINNYYKRQRIPLETQVLLEVASNGALRADLPEFVRRQALSPSPKE